MNRGFRLGPWARFAGSAPRLPAASGREDAPDRGGGLRPVGGRCPACGLPYRGFSGPDTGVIRVDRAQWRAVCPEALRSGTAGLAAPGACRALQGAWRPETRPAGSPKPGAGRS